MSPNEARPSMASVLRDIGDGGGVGSSAVNRLRSNRLVRSVYARLAPSNLAAHRQAKAAVAVSKTLTPNGAAEFTRTLRTTGQLEAALRVAQATVDRAPTSSQAQYERAYALYKAQADGQVEALVAAARGDRVQVTASRIATLGIRSLPQDQWAALESAIEGIDRDGAGPRDKARAMRSFAEARRFHSGLTPDLMTESQNVSPGLIETLVKWSGSTSRWDVLDAVETRFPDMAALGAFAPKALAAVVGAERNRGRLTRMLDAANTALDLGELDGSVAALAAIAEDALALKDNGWRPVSRRSKTSGEAGRVGYLLHNSLPYSTGGYATRSHGLLTGLASRGWDVTALTRPPYPRASPAEKKFRADGLPNFNIIDGIRYERILKVPSGVPFTVRTSDYVARAAAIARDRRFSVIHGASNHANGLAAVEVGALLGIPSVYEVRGLWELTRMSREPDYAQTEMFEMVSRLEAEACSLADHAFAITGAVRDIMVTRGVAADHITILPNGVDVGRFVPLAPNERLRSSLGLEGKVVIGYIGSIVDYEGLLVLVDAVAALAAEGLPVELLIVGDGGVSGDVRARVAEVGIEDITVMPGRVPHHEVEDYYSLVDIAPFPRLPLPVTEAVSPLKPFEAMAMAKPVVVSSVAALAEIVTDGFNGRVFEKGDPASLADVLRELVVDADLRRELGEASRAWVIENRSWRTISQRIDEVYERLGVAGPQ